jgi:hypothetical protein
MASFYHGSYARYLVEATGFRLRQWAKERRHSKPAAGLPDDARLATLSAEFDALVAARDWPKLLPNVRAIALIAEERGDAELMTRMAQALERLGDYGPASELRIAARNVRKGRAANEWQGEDISERTLLIRLVEDDPRSLGRVIRHARLAGAAAGRAKRATIVVEPRLVPLLRRTFPTAEIASPDIGANADVSATFEHLAMAFASDAEQLAVDFVPLRADPHLVGEMRGRYRGASGLPLVGLSWGSKSHTKDVPDFPDWARFLAQIPATFVSLQYGKIGPALRRLRNGTDGRLIHDDTVDQLVDMDRFAAQVAALDAVVTVSNTGAHLAGALGVPTVFLIDDKFHTAWPVIGDSTPWYPHGVVIRREGRPWSAVLREAGDRLQTMIASS